MKTIPLSKSEKVALVDDEDFSSMSQYKWRINNRGYVVHSLRSHERGNPNLCDPLPLHRAVMRSERGRIVDHKNGNRLDNRRSNLRFATNAENIRNQPSAAGVTFHRGRQKWQAAIQFEKRSIYLGVFTDRNDAVAARRAAEIKYFGEFAAIRSEEVA